MDDDYRGFEPDEPDPPEPKPEPNPIAAFHVEPHPWVRDCLEKVEDAEAAVGRQKRTVAQAEEQVVIARRALAEAEEVTHLLAALRSAAGRHHVAVRVEPHETVAGAEVWHLEDGSRAVRWPRESTTEQDPGG